MKTKTMIILASVLGGIAALGVGYSALSKTIQDKILQYVGVTEIRGNRGFSNKEFEKDMLSVGWKQGQAWCMFLCRLIWKEAFTEEMWESAKSLINGSTQNSYQRVRDSKSKFVFVTDKPQVGFIAIWQSRKNPAQGHAGIVTKVGKTTFSTVEGNTNRLDSRDGEGVFAKTRNYTGISTDLKLRGFIGFKTA